MPMLDNIRKFSKTIFAKIFLVILIVPFVFWGMGGVFNSGNTNSLAKINNINVSTQDFINHLNKSGLNSDNIKENLKNNILEKSLTELISNKLLDLEIKDYNLIVSEKILVEKIKNNKMFFDENNKFSRTKYEKFLLYRNITAPEYEKRVKNPNRLLFKNKKNLSENRDSYESEYKFKIGDEIFHEKYGYGTIKYIIDGKYEIVFDKLSKTKIVLENFIKHA